MFNIFILDALRTPFGHPNRSLKDLSAVELAAIAIEKIVKRNSLKASWISQVVLGNVVSAGLGQNIARQAAIKAGLPDTVYGMTINSVCGSGLESIIIAAEKLILNPGAGIIFAGGAESATHNPALLSLKKGAQPVSSLLHDGLFCALSEKPMGELAEGLAKKFEITRKDQDAYSLKSHQKVIEARKKAKLSREIAAIQSGGKKIIKDDLPRENLNKDILTKLPAVFVKGGTVSAGNSSVAADGASVLALASEESVFQYKLKPIAQIMAHAHVSQNPKNVFETAVLAIDECLKKGKLSIKDIDLFEVSESFAVQAIYTQRKLKISDDKWNIYGGDLALGHPLGAAGARIVGTLIHALRENKLKRGIAAVCFGGGSALAVLIEVL